MWAIISLITICFVAFSNIDILAKAVLMIASGLFAIADSIRQLDS